MPALRVIIVCTWLCAGLFSMVELGAAADVTLTGEVVDVESVVSRGADGHGPAHAAATLRLAKEGRTLGVLTDDRLYEITGAFAANRNARLLDFVARRVVVTGIVTEADPRPRLNVTTIRLTTLFP